MRGGAAGARLLADHHRADRQHARRGAARVRTRRGRHGAEQAPEAGATPAVGGPPAEARHTQQARHEDAVVQEGVVYVPEEQYYE